MAKLQNIPEIILLCMEEKFITAFNEALPTQWPSFAENPKVKITVLHMGLHAVPATTKFQLVVSPANSYGRLDGAFDDAISRKFCCPHHPYDTLTRAAQQVLYEKWRGFAPPGSCTLVPFPKDMEGTNAWGCKWVAVCPTMRAPDNVMWDREVVYECVWSLLCQVEGWNHDRSEDRIDSILMTPLATGIGRVTPQRWASQLILAIKHFVDALERPERWIQLGWRDIEEDMLEVEETWKE
ncbi:hypothetical protein BDV38DRAFT_223324 [Aspergillus pseudotamarii]|uniref:Macro domain-like protein n=1 Tax=Aspergillus pseudotamarii TaxID=132259 RepID=A0A5N6T4L1_ASPPS|nr:uncharacterized protein BDV38DRAFT_223324 [Aspergillus pseudotamarii]KAE8141199.1 hypothetical protein BDV38DRAFT_223324 [Aspergillus pseudotamarii]